MRRLELSGHTVSYWIDDELGLFKADRPARIRRDMREWFAPIEGPVFYGLDQWYGPTSRSPRAGRPLTA